MKKILLFFLFTSICLVSNAKNSNVNTCYNVDSLQNQISASINNLQQLIDTLNKVQNNIQSLQNEKDNLKTANERLVHEKESILSDFSSQLLCKMLLNYPLNQKFDSSLVSYSKYIITTYGMKDKYPNLYKNLEKYEEFNNEIFGLINKYISFTRNGIPRTQDSFQEDYRRTKYYKEWDRGNGIPYIDQQIDKVLTMYRNNTVNLAQLEEVAHNLK